MIFFQLLEPVYRLGVSPVLVISRHILISEPTTTFSKVMENSSVSEEIS